MRALITGGAGYIGSHTAKELARAGHEPIVLDDLRRGNRWAVRWGPLLEIDLADQEAVETALQSFQIEAVFHFAALAYVAESMSAPADYFRNNVVNTHHLLEAMRRAGTSHIVFSSTCSTYGNPEHMPIREGHPQRPTSPYGESKLMVERMLQWYGSAYGLSWTALRYFNAAGADPDGELGEAHRPETHLIPRAIAAAYGDIPELEVFGTDYETPDGTAVRDYIHVTDLASAHIQAIERLLDGGSSAVMNLGTGRGYSVREIIADVERVTRRRVPALELPRRAGDPPIMVADSALAASALGWSPQHSSPEKIVGTAAQWYTSRRSETPVDPQS